jgi:hypothetical protein
MEVGVEIVQVAGDVRVVEEADQEAYGAPCLRRIAG